MKITKPVSGNTSVEHAAPRVIDLSTNDYLGLSRDRDVREAAIRAIAEQGVGGRTIRRTVEDDQFIDQLERAIASFEEAPGAIVTQSGYMANTSLVPCVVGLNELFTYDAYAHPSIVDGGRLACANCVPFRHLDLDHLDQILRRFRDTTTQTQRAVIATDGVFGTDGEVAPLPDIVNLAHRYDATLIVDDAHATGVLGATGRGTTEHFGLSMTGLIKTGTLSKALGAAGGFIAAADDVRSLVLRKGHAILYSTITPHATLAAALASLRKLQAQTERIQRLRENTAYLRQLLVAAGLTIGSGEAGIIAIFAKKPQDVSAAVSELKRQRVIVRSVLPPRVHDEHACIRIMMSSERTSGELDEAAAQICAAASVCGLLPG